jgi:hypothetical protein
LKELESDIILKAVKDTRSFICEQDFNEGRRDRTQTRGRIHIQETETKDQVRCDDSLTWGSGQRPGRRF